jgi:5-methylcytosine-specific restriction endonuclease McrA
MRLPNLCGGNMPYTDKEKQKEWVANHREELRTYHTEWVKRKKAEDPEKFNKDACSKVKKYYRNHRALCLERAETYRKENPDKVKAATDLWFAKNKEYRRKYKAKYRRQHREQIAEYRKANRERNLVYKANRKTRLTNAGGAFTLKEWITLCIRYGNKCLCCDKTKPLTVDHVIPVSKGGTSYISNIQPLCGPCNSTKHDNVVDYRKG